MRQGFSKVGEAVILRPVLRSKDPRSRERRPFGITLRVTDPERLGLSRENGKALIYAVAWPLCAWLK
jgi:hypothetical protein